VLFIIIFGVQFHSIFRARASHGNGRTIWAHYGSDLIRCDYSQSVGRCDSRWPACAHDQLTHKITGSRVSSVQSMCYNAVNEAIDTPKLRPYGAIQICLLLLFLYFLTPVLNSRGMKKLRYAI